VKSDQRSDGSVTVAQQGVWEPRGVRIDLNRQSSHIPSGKSLSVLNVRITEMGISPAMSMQTGSQWDDADDDG